MDFWRAFRCHNGIRQMTFDGTNERNIAKAVRVRAIVFRNVWKAHKFKERIHNTQIGSAHFD